jgi:hypothetical protein
MPRIAPSEFFLTIAQEFIDSGNTQYTSQSINWFKERVRQLQFSNEIPQEEVFAALGSGLQSTTNVSRTVSRVRTGRMYLYEYMPLNRQTLPYYDQFPLIIALESSNTDFLGLNLHYLPIRFRVYLYQKLGRLLNNRNYNVTTHWQRLSYEQLLPFTRYREAKPCIKRYKYRRVLSSIVTVFPVEWELALMLPLQRFKKAKEQTVWINSRQQIRRRT